MSTRFWNLAIRLSVPVSVTLASMLGALPAGASIMQSAFVQYLDIPTNVFFEDTLPGGIGVLAQISDPSFGSAFASAGEFGNVGLQANQRRRGAMVTRTDISSDRDENTNWRGGPLRAAASFIIDGGSIFLDAIGFIRYGISLKFEIRDGDSNLEDIILWDTGGVVLDSLLSGPTFMINGTDIGASLTGRTVQIPLTFVGIDLGIVPGRGGSVAITYTADFRSDLSPLLLEAAGWSFSDPGNVSGVGDFPTIAFTALNDVPESSTLALLAAGIIPVVLLRASLRSRVSR